jgi:ATP/maltotriose-dependent transcriptional regulator MalT
MSGVPHNHNLRPRLIPVLSAAPVGVIEAGGGYGKSALAIGLAMSRGIAFSRLCRLWTSVDLADY